VKYTRVEGYFSPPSAGSPGPYLAVRIQYKGRALDTYALVDSGCDISTFHTDFATILGIDLANVVPSKTIGIGGVARVFPFDVNLVVLGITLPARVNFCETCPKAFGLLGRQDFFRAFHIGFDEKASQLLLYPTLGAS